MSWSILQQAGTTSAGGATSQAFGTNLSAGSTLLAFVAVDVTNASNSISSVKDTAGNSFSLVGYAITPTDEGTVAVYALNTPSGDVGSTTTITVTPSLTCFGISLVILEVAGISATPDGTAATDTGSASPAINGSYSSSASSEFLVFWVGDNGYTTTYSTPTGYTASTANQASNGNAEGVLFYKNSTGGSETASSTIGASSKWGSVMVAFPLSNPGTNSGPNYAGAASDMGGGSGSWSNVANAEGAPDGSTADWTAP